VTDVSKLVVGQEVRISSGCYGGWTGKVVDVTPERHVIVDVDGDSLAFDQEGKALNINPTYECGPFYIEGFEPKE
jgi:hypothetical protein